MSDIINASPEESNWKGSCAIPSFDEHPVPQHIRMEAIRLERGYFEHPPDLADPNQPASIGTFGSHCPRFCTFFTETHILALTQAICNYRRSQGTNGPLFMGKDSHVLSGLAHSTALEVLAGNGVETVIQQDSGVTPTPIISRAILLYNRNRKKHFADGILVTPSHSPPTVCGFRYILPNGGPSHIYISRWIEDQAKRLLRDGNVSVKRLPIETALKVATTHREDFILPYVNDLHSIIDMQAIRDAGLHLAIDQIEGVALPIWELINSVYRLDIEVVAPTTETVFPFTTVDQQVQVRLDSSSPYKRARLLTLNEHRLALANACEADHQSNVTAGAVLKNLNHYLPVAILYLLTHRPRWPSGTAIGKTLICSAMFDRVVHGQGRRLFETPVGFRWFVSGLVDASLCFGGEGSTGASFLRRDGTVWTTDKDGVIMELLEAEIIARTGKDAGEHFNELAWEFGLPFDTRLDVPAGPEQKARLRRLSLDAIRVSSLASEPITAILTRAPGNLVAIGGLKVVSANGWFVALPSVTENLYRIFAESFRDLAHLDAIVDEAQGIVSKAVAS
jgi:phosphoglucomutase